MEHLYRSTLKNSELCAAHWQQVDSLHQNLLISSANHYAKGTKLTENKIHVREKDEEMSLGDISQDS